MEENSKSSKKPLYIILAILGVVIVALAAAIVWLMLSKSSPEKKIESYINLGQDYLEDKDYESALIEFEKVLDLDSENVDAYVGLYEAYEGLEEYEMAMQICQEGYDETGSNKLKRKITYFQELLASSDKGNDEDNGVNSEAAENSVENTVENKEEETVVDSSDDDSEAYSDDELYARFFNGEVGARDYNIDTYEYIDDEYYYDITRFDGFDIPEIKWFDMDNDGKNEPYWDMHDGSGMIAIDARNGELYIIAQGEGTAIHSSYTVYDGETYLVISDTSHVGRQIYSLRKLNGNGDIVDEFDLGAEYWDEPDDMYNENSDFYYRGETITMEEYESLRNAYFGY